ncbi:MAG: DNA translocase FtsK 4TM domain-containing protein, partial [Bacteroidia bacterium]
MSTEKKNKFRNKPTVETVVEETQNPFDKVERLTEEKKRPRKEIKEETEDVIEKKTKPKNAPKTKTETTAPETRKEKTSLIQRWQQLTAIYSNERTQKIIGLLLVLFSSYLAIAFTSYFFTWDVDQDKVLDSASTLFNPETKVQNWLGKAGALISHLFLYKGFGAASFILVPVLFIYGLQKTVQKKFINVSSFNAKWLFLMTWSSLVLAYVFSDRMFFMGGGFGYFINTQISNMVGGLGLLALLAFSMLTFLVLVINLSFKLPAKPVLQQDEIIEEELKTPEPSKDFNTSFNEVKDLKLTAEEEEELLNFEIKQKGEDLVITPVKEDKSVGLEVVAPGNDSLINVVEDEKIETADKGAQVTLDTTNETPVNEVKGEPEFEIGKTVDEPVIIEEENKAAKLVEEFGEYDPTLDLGHYKFPGFDLLNDYGNSHNKVNQEELVANKDRIIATLKNYGIEIDKIMATVGPTVTLYEIVPAAGVRISKIKNLEDDIALSLAALGIRIIAPIPGKGTIGIEVPNQTPEMVPMRNILASEKFNNSTFDLPIALGKTISNEIFIADLAKMPHLLMAGATGQGKSVGLNAVLVSLLYKKHPAQIKFVLVDPKKVELTLFNKIERHFLAKLPNSEDAIITDNTKVIHTLNSLCIEMDNRYALLQDAQCRNIKEYNTKFINRKLNPNDGHKYLPYIILVVDEFADLIMTAGKEVETPIARLAQLAR